MGNMFGPSSSDKRAAAENRRIQQRSQRKQDRMLSDQIADEAKERGSRNRMINGRRGGSSLFAKTGAAGVRKETLG